MFKILYICSIKGDHYRNKRFIEEFSKNPEVNLCVCDVQKLLQLQKNQPHKIIADAVITMYANKEVGFLVEQNNLRSFNKVSSSFIANNK